MCVCIVYNASYDAFKQVSLSVHNGSKFQIEVFTGPIYYSHTHLDHCKKKKFIKTKLLYTHYDRMLSLSTPTILKTLCYNLPSFRSMLSIFGFIQGLSTHHFKQQQKLENSIMTIEMQCMSRSFQICYYFYYYFFFVALYTSSKPRTHSRR